MRKFVMLFAMFLMAVFAYTGTTTTSVAAAGDASWDNGTLVYNGASYTGPQTSDGNNLPNMANGLIFYVNADQSGNGSVIYFDSSTTSSNLSKATTAYYRTGKYNTTTGIFSGLSPPQTISVDSSTYSAAPASSCNISGVGWIVCPLSNFIASGMDYLYKVVASFLTVAPISTDTSGPMYQMWRIVLGIANLMFIIAFLILIYAQVSGGLLTNYTIKKTLPRIIIAAVLVNISYWICAVAVDISNVLGASVYDLMKNTYEHMSISNATGGKLDFSSVNWTNVTATALGGAGAIGTITLIAATGGGATAFGFLILAALIPAIFAAFVAVGVLAARQALITIFVVISPLAFAAYLLPNTEEWFKRWRKLFISMLMMFPAFSVIFAGAQITGTLIIQTAHSLPVIVLGLVVQAVPLFITPFLIRLSSGILSTVTGHINDRSKGMFDRAQGWASANKDLHRERAIRNGMQRRPELSLKKGKRLRTARALARPTTTGAYLATRSMHREKMMSGYKSQTEGSYGNTRGGRRSFTEGQVGDLYKSASHAANEEMWQARVAGVETSTRRTQRGRDREDERYRHLEHMTHAAHSAEGRANILKESIHEAGERHFRESIADAAAGTYEATLRARQVQATVDKGIAEHAKKFVDAQGTLALKQTIEGDLHLRNQAIQSVQFEKQAAEYETIVQKAAEAAYDTYSRTNQVAQELRLRAVEQTDLASTAEKQWSQLVRDIQVNGSGSAHVNPGTGPLANAVRQAAIQQSAAKQSLDSSEAQYNAYIDELKTAKGADQHGLAHDATVQELQAAAERQRVETQRAGAAKRVSDVEYAVRVQDDTTGLAVEAGGIEGTAGISQAKSVAFQTIVDAFNKGVAAEKTPLSRIKPDELLGTQYLGAADILDQPTERISAIAGMVASGSHHESHIKLWQRMRELKQLADNELAVAQQSGNTAAIAEAEDKAGKVKDLQQQIMGDKKKVPFGVGDMDLGNANVGRYENDIYETTRSRINTHLSAQKLAEMDPDDIRLIFEMARAGKLDQEQLNKVNKAYEDWANDPILKATLADKHKTLLDPIAEHARTGIANYQRDGDRYPNVHNM